MIIDGKVKNQFRVRKISLVSIVSNLLNKKKPKGISNDPVIDDYCDFKNYSHALSRELKRWNSEVKIKPKDLRNTLQTEAIDGGWYDYYVQRFVGHAPKSIGERHYHGNQGKRMISFYREKVVSQVERIIDDWDAPIDTYILTDHKTVYKNEQNCTIIARLESD